MQKALTIASLSKLLEDFCVVNDPAKTDVGEYRGEYDAIYKTDLPRYFYVMIDKNNASRIYRNSVPLT
jgi:hypothetical protein